MPMNFPDDWGVRKKWQGQSDDNPRVGKELMSWDTSELSRNHIDDRMENWKDIYGYSRKPSYEEAQRDDWEDDDAYNADWDFMIDCLTEEMKEKNPDGFWTASVRGFGWRRLDGEMDIFYADTGAKLLGKILPKTDCTFHIHEYGKTGFAIHNYHHDSPTGEWYYILKAEQKEEE